MKLEAMEEGIPSEDIFMDHAGFSTYESIFRARDVFAADKIIIVTQEYHLYRALHVANALGVEAYGVAADYHTYVGQAYREVREILARNKDFATSILKPAPTYLGEVIPVSGDGNLTNDEDMAVAVDALEPVLPPEEDEQEAKTDPIEMPEDTSTQSGHDELVEPPTPEPEKDAFVQVAAWLPDVKTELRYATENNFTGQVIYSFDEAWLRYGTVQKLAKAQSLLAEQGYSLLIWDAFRPTAAQWKLWEVFPDPVYVANPEKGYSSHSRGNTVDVTLVTSAGELVEMPTEFDDFSLLADRDYSDVPEEAAQNALLLEKLRQIPAPERKAATALPEPPPIPPRMLPVWEAAFADTEAVPVAQAAGRISAGQVGLYPPGVAALAAGEEITPEIVQWLTAMPVRHLFGLDEAGRLTCVKEGV